MALARNSALQQALYGNVIFLDADCHPSLTWLSSYVELSQLHLKDDVVAIAGENSPPSVNHWIYNGVRTLKHYPLLHLNSTQLLRPRDILTSVRHAPTCNILYRKDAVLTALGFDKLFDRAGEDLDLNTRLIASGKKILFSNSPSVTHHDKSNWRCWFKKIFNYGKTQPTILRRHAFHVDRERWLPVLVILFSFLGLLVFPKNILLVAATGIVVIFLMGIFKGPKRQAFQWTGFVIITVIAYCLGYLWGSPAFIKIKKNN